MPCTCGVFSKPCRSVWKPSPTHRSCCCRRPTKTSPKRSTTSLCPPKRTTTLSTSRCQTSSASSLPTPKPKRKPQPRRRRTFRARKRRRNGGTSANSRTSAFSNFRPTTTLLPMLSPMRTTRKARRTMVTASSRTSAPMPRYRQTPPLRTLRRKTTSSSSGLERLRTSQWAPISIRCRHRRRRGKLRRPRHASVVLLIFSLARPPAIDMWPARLLRSLIEARSVWTLSAGVHAGSFQKASEQISTRCQGSRSFS